MVKFGKCFAEFMILIPLALIRVWLFPLRYGSDFKVINKQKQKNHIFNTGVNQKVLPVLSTETLLHIWLSTEYYGFRPSSTAVDTVSLHALDPTVPRKRMQIGFLLAPIVKEVSNIVSNLLMCFLLQRLT